ncbi:methylcytosine dioxygenase TET2 [Lampris incognitus]|uniref:methylcytosine dioxygenase TET2 n=1 Tax=Lampris incognitus TaxID=2546036 RepID=UPI0024B531C2|nr:methylcytosine dioxygenase TET2 [Lampris incognitus]
METENASHETEESLILAQFTAAHTSNNLITATKLQNGTHSPEGPSLHINGDDNWNHYKPHTAVTSMKRHREICNSSTSVQGLFDQTSYMMNGEMKNALTEQSLLTHQPKKLRADSETKGDVDMTSNLVDNIPELTKVTEFECDILQNETKLDKRNCNFQNGDIFCVSSNKQLSISNGEAAPPSMEGTPGDLLEKTLSQYYPEQVSIAPQTTGPQSDIVNGSLANELPNQGAQTSPLTSGFTSSAQKTASEQQQHGPAHTSEDIKSYNSTPYVVNGYSKDYGADTRQQQHQQQPYSAQDQKLPLDQVGQLPGMAPSTNTAKTSQHQNGPECYPEDSNSQVIYGKPNKELSQDSFLGHNTHLQTGEGSGFTPFPNPGLQRMRQREEPGSGQRHQQGIEGGLQYGMQPQSFQQNSGNLCGAETIINSLCLSPQTQNSAAGPQQPHPAGLENGTHSMSQPRGNLSCPTPHQRGWIDQNSSHSQQRAASGPPSQTQEQDMWKGFPPRSQSQQQTTNPHAQGQMLGPDSMQRFQTQGGFTESTPESYRFQQQQQDCLPAQSHSTPAQHNTAPEWQQANSKASPLQQTLSQKLPQQCNRQPQADSHYRTHMQPERLCESDPDLQEILSPGYLLPQQHQHCQQQQQQRPLSHPPQFEGQQLKSPNYRPHSQPQPTSAMRNSPAQSNIQHPHQNNHATFSHGNTMKMQPQQRQYVPNSGSNNFKQYPSQHPTPHYHQASNMDFPKTTTQSQPHLLHDMLKQPVSAQTYSKDEKQQQESCALLQRGPQLPLGPTGPNGDFQRHAALRMHLLQRQERQGPPHAPQSPSDLKQSLRAVKMENGPRFQPPGVQQQEQQLQRQDMGMTGAKIKQEHFQSMCEQNNRQGSILASMEQSLRQYQLSPVFEKKSLVVNSLNKVKVESSGAVTILSTNTELGGGELQGGSSTSVVLKKAPDFTPKKEPLLQSFMDSPMKLLDTPMRNLLDTPIKTQYDIASCHCVEQISEKDEGPYYTHLGAAPNIASIRDVMEKRSGLTGRAIRIEKVIYTGKEGKSTQGCPIAKWVIRRSSVEEKLLVLVRERAGHTCETSCIIVVILVWEGIPQNLADRLYLELSDTLTKHGALTQRRCALNEERTCACQGLDPDACGASFSFGCSWSMYYNGCKFARSKIPRKFKLLGDDSKEEEKLEQNLQNLATLMAPTYKTLAPEAYGNQVEHEHRAPDCRLGLKEGRPFSGVTACMDFCAHAHRDLHNMQGGSTVVCTLTREDNREIGKIPEDEQLHVLPLYKASSTDEFGSEEGQQEKIKSGAIQVLSAFRRQVRMLPEPAKSCRQKKLDAKKAAANKNAIPDTPNVKAEKAFQAKSKAGTYESIGHSTPGIGHLSGAMAETLQPGQPKHLLGTHPQQLQQQQHPNFLPPYAGSPHPTGYPRFPNHSGPFPSTSKPDSMYPPQPPTPASPYTSPLHLANSYMNGSNRPHAGYQCNGGMPLDNYHPYYASNPKHPDMYPQQGPVLYPEQQYRVHQHIEVNYSPRYGEPGLQVNGYNACSMKPSVHTMGRYSPYGPNGTADHQFMGTLSRPPPAHPSLDYAAVSKGNQFGGYPNPYLSQSPKMFPPGHDPFSMQIKTEMGVSGPQALPLSLTGEGLTPGIKSGFPLPNGSFMGSTIKQEPETPPTPTIPQKPEMWSDNEHNFLDPEIGGVAVAPSHGSILIECAKRELHATTPLKNPDRNHPTRISLVFYQHKNMNEAKHGLALWEAKMAEKAREKEEDAEKNGGDGTPNKSSSKKGVKREHPESSEPSGEPPYKRFIQTLMEGSLSCTTNTYVSTSPYAFTKVTGPYSRFV